MAYNKHSKKESPHQLARLDMEVTGKVPPQAPEMEEAVLGAMLLESRCIDQVMGILKPESFYKFEHQAIFKAICEMKGQSRPVDLLTVTDHLRKSGKLEEVGGPAYVTRLTSKVASASHVETHARIVQQMFLKREIIRISGTALQQGFDISEDPEETIESILSQVTSLLTENQTANAEPIRDILHRRVKEIEEISKHKSDLIGVPSSLTNLDRSTGGWQNTDLIIIAARPSMGKTAFSLFTSLQSATMGFPVAFFSLEMSKSQLFDRSLSAMTTLSPLLIRSGLADWQELESGVGKLENLPVYIDDTPALTLPQLRAKAMQLMKFKIKLIVIDYLQLMNARGEGDTRDQEVGYLSRGLKALAKELNVPIIALSQLNRAADGKRPVLANLRESGNLEQDADMVLFIHRPEKYGILNDEAGISTKGMVELIIDKHRNGPTGLVECHTNEYCTRFAVHASDLTDNVQSKPMQEIGSEKVDIGGREAVFSSFSNHEDEPPY